ncbi:hypothetical protein GYH30_022724 [Glycine max]|uniref:Uncharacterized protein n=1 Tax=Glycine max TaxID=3847 RepID=A0A0R0IZI5_SOYBN|nr:hypothetical protein GYH30_022724 [Glycine max]
MADEGWMRWFWLASETMRRGGSGRSKEFKILRTPHTTLRTSLSHRTHELSPSSHARALSLSAHHSLSLSLSAASLSVTFLLLTGSWFTPHVITMNAGEVE